MRLVVSPKGNRESLDGETITGEFHEHEKVGSVACVRMGQNESGYEIRGLSVSLYTFREQERCEKCVW